MPTLRRILLVALIAWAAATSGADALARKDIYGKWCSAGGSEEFAADTLTAIRNTDGARFVFSIESYEFEDTTVTVNWINGKKDKVYTQFGEFSRDGERMVQFQNEAGPRREFHRC